MAAQGFTLDPPDLPIKEWGVSRQDAQVFFFKWGRGDFRGQRLGQAFVNWSRMPRSPEEMELFFLKDSKRAKQMIYQFVKE